MCQLDYGGYGSFSKWKENKKWTVVGEFTEGINNAMSTILHSMFLSCEEGKKWEYYLSEEIKHSELLCGNILGYFRCDTLEYLMNNDNVYTQTSQVFEYVFLRHIYLIHKDLWHLNGGIVNKKQYYDLFIKRLVETAPFIKSKQSDDEFRYVEYYKSRMYV